MYNSPTLGTLFIVATPIGNLADISYRAIDILKSVDLILAEDTRRTGIILKHYSIDSPMESFHEHNEEKNQKSIIGRLINRESMAIVSDAGTPTVSDPGFKLVRECAREKITVVPIPGPCAPITSLVGSGLPTDSFVFLGFVPKKEGKRSKFYDKINTSIKDIRATVIFFETPPRLNKTLEELKNKFPVNEIVIAREITKVNEEFIRGKVSEIQSQLKDKKLKGEVTLLLR